MKRLSLLFVAVILAMTISPSLLARSVRSAQAAATKKNVVLHASEIGPNLFPDKVFFRGSVVTVQYRNTGGVHFADGAYFLAGRVDSSGYSSEVQEKYQAYILTEVPLEMGGRILRPGAYGMGFLKNGKFLVMDLGAHTVLETSSRHDAALPRPTPLQVTAGEHSGAFRLYVGRDYVEFRRAR